MDIGNILPCITFGAGLILGALFFRALQIPVDLAQKNELTTMRALVDKAHTQETIAWTHLSKISELSLRMLPTPPTAEVVSPNFLAVDDGLPPKPNLTCHGVIPWAGREEHCRRQVPHDHVGPCPYCGSDEVYL
jgi:hypothetical protein